MISFRTIIYPSKYDHSKIGFKMRIRGISLIQER